MNALFGSLQARLIFAFVLVTAVALAIAAGVFVAARQDDQERQELDRVAAASPAIVRELFAAMTMERDRFDPEAFAAQAANRHDVRVLVIASGEVVAADSAGSLVGTSIPAPREKSLRLGAKGQPYTAFDTANGTATDDLVFVEAAVPQFAGGGPLAASVNDQRVVLAVPESTIRRAWLDLLPALGVAAAVAFPVAILLAVLLARSIARPVHQLTLASRQLADGSFDIDVPTGREDELGRLGDAFATMATRVGETQTQMRQLVANVSHDLKTPLTSILGFSRALSSGVASSEDEARRMGAVIEEEAQRLSARLNDLLLLSELDAGRTVVDWAEVDLGRLVSSVSARLTPHRDPRLQSGAVGEGVVVWADGQKLERIVENLVNNAVKFTPDGGSIHIRVVPLERGGGMVEVANTAPGLRTEDLPLLFERFFRDDRARSTAGGSGLGLSIARDLARLQGGSLDARIEGGVLILRLALLAPTP